MVGPLFGNIKHVGHPHNSTQMGQQQQLATNALCAFTCTYRGQTHGTAGLSQARWNTQPVAHHRVLDQVERTQLYVSSPGTRRGVPLTRGRCYKNWASCSFVWLVCVIPMWRAFGAQRFGHMHVAPATATAVPAGKVRVECQPRTQPRRPWRSIKVQPTGAPHHRWHATSAGAG